MQRLRRRLALLSAERRSTPAMSLPASIAPSSGNVLICLLAAIANILVRPTGRAAGAHLRASAERSNSVGDGRPTARDVALAGCIAAVLSGLPSTAHALVRRKDPLEASLAAGSLLLPRERRPARLLAAAALAHGALSLWWAWVLAVSLPRRARLSWATLAGLAIAALDLGIVGRHFPRIRALPRLPQIADHLAFTWTVAAVLSRRCGSGHGRRR